MKNFASQKGISLVALIITIVVMVILAGIIIVSAVADGGIIDRAQTALIEQERANAQDIIETSYVYKTTASQATYKYLDIPKTAEAIFNNLTSAGFKLKKSDGTEAARVEDIYTEGDKIDLNIKGKRSEYEGTVSKTGLDNNITIKEIEETITEETYLTLTTNREEIFTSDFVSIYGNMGTTQVQNLAKLVYKYNEYSLQITNARTDSFGSTYLVEVKYYKNNELITSYILRKSGGYSFNDDGTSNNCHSYPHYPTGWTDKVKVTGICSNCNGNIYGVLLETEFPKFIGDWEIDTENSNDYGIQYLSNVLVEK